LPSLHDFIDSFFHFLFYLGLEPCAVSSAPCFCIDVKNVAGVS